MVKRDKKRIGLVLTGGGARSAYQVGVLSAIAELIDAEESPFSIISAYSAGAVSAAWLASQQGSFKLATQQLRELWSSLTAEQIFHTDPFSLGMIALRWIRDRSLGGIFSTKKQITYLLDTAPLKKLLQEKIDFEILNANIEN